MKKLIVGLVAIAFLATNSFGQSRGIKVGYIDMEYILDKVPDYAEAKNQLDQKAQKWKQEIEEKKIEIAKLKETLKTEKVLLTKELIDEREEEIGFLETDLLDYQQKRFGPNGDLIIQKTVLVKPIQDQVFNAVQDIADQSKYDFIFDRSSDLTMLYANKRNDISDKVVRILVRAQNREQISKKQLEKEAEAERKADQISDNPALAERQKKLDERKVARDKMLADRKLAAEAKKKEFEERRQQLLEERENKKNGTVSDNPKTETPESGNKTTSNKEEDDTKAQDALDKEQKKADADAAKSKTLEDRKKVLEDRKKAAQEKRQKILDDREAAKKAKEENKTVEKP